MCGTRPVPCRFSTQKRRGAGYPPHSPVGGAKVGPLHLTPLMGLMSSAAPTAGAGRPLTFSMIARVT